MAEQLNVGKTTSYSNSLSSEVGMTSYKFDVFLSFRGPDVRKKFASHLYHRLKCVGFQVYLDAIEMNKGEEINEELKRAIINSRICMPIFSTNYASSKACLLELSYMVQCEKKIIPIFYDVTPDDVKLKTPLYKKDLEDHRGNPKLGIEEVESWERALLAVAEKSGYDILNKNEAEEITSITWALISQLMPKQLDVTDKLVEIDLEVKSVVELLDLNSDGFRIVGVFGMGGIGKTTLAKVLFNQLKSSFPSCCSFLENIRENLGSQKLLDLQRQIYKDIINPFYGDSIHSYNDWVEMIRRGLENKNALLVLDDMNDADQLTKLLGHHLCFTSGSRLIITTRDRKVLDVLNQKHKNVLAYDLKEMDSGRALKLFSRCAFREDSPPLEFQHLSREVVLYTNGLPLVLEVFGSLLFDSDKNEWEGTLEELKRFPDKSINDKLMISYHKGLKPNQQNIFLDIASYYGHLEKERACYMWEDCGWCPKPAIKTLKDRSLIKIINAGSEHFWMHDVLKDLGRALIQADGDKSGRIPSRLRIDSTLDILYEAKEKAHLETLTIHAPTVTITREDLIGLKKLRFLELNVQNVEGDFNGLFPNLRWFCCSEASEFRQMNFNQEKLLVLELVVSDFTQNFEGRNTIKVDKLKVLDLKRPRHKFPKHLEDKLIEAQRDAYWISQKLTAVGDIFKSINNPFRHGWDGRHLNLKRILNATNLEKLSLRLDYPVTSLEEMGELSRLRDLDLSYVKFQYLPHLPSSLLQLTLSYCEFAQGILDLSNLKNLTIFKILSPDKLNEIKGLEDLYSLKVLSLQNMPNRVHYYPFGEDTLPPTLPKNLTELDISCSDSFRELPDLSSLKGLCSLRLLWCVTMKKIVSFNGLESLTQLFIWNCQYLYRLPDLSTLRKLRSLKLQACAELTYIEGIPNLESLEIVQIALCDYLELCPHDFTKLEKVRSVYIRDCRRLPYICKEPVSPSDNPFLPLRLIEPISGLARAFNQLDRKRREDEDIEWYFEVAERRRRDGRRKRGREREEETDQVNK